MFGALAGALAAGDFYDPVHREIYATITQLLLASRPADVITVFEAGGHDLGYLNSLAWAVPSSRHAAGYAQIVREHALRREAMRLAGRLREDAQAAQVPVPELIEATVAALLALQRGRGRMRRSRCASWRCAASTICRRGRMVCRTRSRLAWRTWTR